MPLCDLARAVETFDKIPHCRLLGLRLSALEPGKGTAILPYDRRLVGNPRTGVVHGGVITTLLDTLSGIVVMTAVPEGTSLATLDLRIDYLRPATPGQPIRGTAECYKLTPNIAFVRGVAYHTDRDDPIARCTGTFMLGATGFRAQSAPPSEGGGQPC